MIAYIIVIAAEYQRNFLVIITKTKISQRAQEQNVNTRLRKMLLFLLL